MKNLAGTFFSVGHDIRHPDIFAVEGQGAGIGASLEDAQILAVGGVLVYGLHPEYRDPHILAIKHK